MSPAKRFQKLPTQSLPFLSEGTGVAALFFLTACLYLPLRHAGFVYDDQWYVSQNPGIRRLDLFTIFTDPQQAAAPSSGLAMDAYRPLVTASFALDYRLWGLHPAGFHIENILLHLVNAFMVWLLMRRLLWAPAARGLALGIFLWHPVQVQSVAWVSQRSTLMGSTGMLLSLLMLGAPGPWPWRKVIAGFMAYGAALFCRETTGGVILALALLDMLYAKENGGLKAFSHRPGFWNRYVGLIVLTGIYIAARSHLLPSWSMMDDGPGWRTNLPLGLMAFAVYIGKLLLPIHLRMHYDYPNPDVLLMAGSALVALVYLGFIWRSARRHLRLSGALAWIIIFLIPVLQWIPIRAFAAERYLYFSVIGFAWAAAWVYTQFPKTRIALGMVVLLYGITSASLIPRWSSEITLWKASVQQDPQDNFAQAAYASCVQDPELAEMHWRKALGGNPTTGVRLAAFTNLSWLALEKKQFRKAQTWALLALRLDPREPHALHNLLRAREGLKPGKHTFVSN